jgi:hypothetical protein
MKPRTQRRLLVIYIVIDAVSIAGLVYMCSALPNVTGGRWFLSIIIGVLILHALGYAQTFTPPTPRVTSTSGPRSSSVVQSRWGDR